MAEMTFPSADKERRSESEYAVSSKENEHLKIIYKKVRKECLHYRENDHPSPSFCISVFSSLAPAKMER